MLVFTYLLTDGTLGLRARIDSVDQNLRCELPYFLLRQIHEHRIVRFHRVYDDIQGTRT